RDLAMDIVGERGFLLGLEGAASVEVGERLEDEPVELAAGPVADEARDELVCDGNALRLEGDLDAAGSLPVPLPAELAEQFRIGGAAYGHGRQRIVDQCQRDVIDLEGRSLDALEVVFEKDGPLMDDDGRNGEVGP